jgi:hypothetical protein
VVEEERTAQGEPLTLGGLRELIDALASYDLIEATIHPTSASVLVAEDAFEPAEPMFWNGSFLLPDDDRHPVETDGSYTQPRSFQLRRILRLVDRAERELGEEPVQRALLLGSTLPHGTAAGYARTASGKQSYVFAGADGTLVAVFTVD